MKDVKSIVNEFNRKLTRREASRKAQNERRKAQRRLAKVLSEETGEKISWKEATTKYAELGTKSSEATALSKMITSLESKTVEGTKRKVGYGVDLEKVSKSLASYTRERFGSETLSKKGYEPNILRKNEMFTYQINQATRKDGLSTLEASEVHSFYAATQFIWGGVSASDNRNAVIMREFGLRDLKQVYDLITNEELNAEDFGFDDEELFEEWLDEIKSRVDLDSIREAFHDVSNGEMDEPQTKYPKIRIANIRIRTSNIKRYAS